MQKWLTPTILIVLSAMVFGAALTKRWFHGSGRTEVSVGLVATKACERGECRTLSTKELDDTGVLMSLDLWAPIDCYGGECKANEGRLEVSVALLEASYYGALGFGALLAVLSIWFATGNPHRRLLTLAMVIDALLIMAVATAFMTFVKSIRPSYSFWIFAVAACGTIPTLLHASKELYGRTVDWIEPSETGSFYS